MNPDKHGTLSGYTNDRCRCEDCRAANAAWKREYRRAGRENRARVSQRQKEWRVKNPTYDRDWAAAHSESRRLSRRKWDNANAEKRRALEANRDKFKQRERAQLRRSRLTGAEARLVSLRDWCRLIERYRERCAYCGERGPLTQEHVIPLSRGGRHSIGNLLPVCGSCNSRKGQRLLIEWRCDRIYSRQETA